MLTALPSLQDYYLNSPVFSSMNFIFYFIFTFIYDPSEKFLLYAN